MKIGSNPADSICIVRFVGCQAPTCILISGQGCARIVREKCTNLKKEVIDMKILKQRSKHEWNKHEWSVVFDYVATDFDGRSDSPLKADWNPHTGYYNIHYCIANDNRLEDI